MAHRVFRWFDILTIDKVQLHASSLASLAAGGTETGRGMQSFAAEGIFGWNFDLDLEIGSSAAAVSAGTGGVATEFLPFEQHGVELFLGFHIR